MKRTIITLSIIFAAILLYAGPQIRGNGKVVKQEHAASPFTGIEAGGVFRLIVTQADQCSVSVETGENLMDLVTVGIANGKLNLSMKGGIKHYSAMNVYISLPKLNALHLSGAAKAEFTTDMKTTDKIKISLSGTSSIRRANFHAAQAVINLTGASKMETNLTADQLNVSVSGTSSLRATAAVGELRIGNSGASKSSINVVVSGMADLSASGTSSITGQLTADNLRAEAYGASSLKLSGQWGNQKLSAYGTSNIDLHESVSLSTEVSASGVSRVSAGHTSISKINTSGTSTIKSSPPKTDSKELQDIASRISSEINEKISNDSNSIKLQQVAAEFAELAKKLSDKAAKATININGKDYVLKDTKISVVNNSDGSVSLFMNEEEAYRLTK